MKKTLGITLSQKLISEFRAYCMKKASEKVCEDYIRRLEEIDREEKPIDRGSKKAFLAFSIEKPQNKNTKYAERLRNIMSIILFESNKSSEISLHSL